MTETGQATPRIAASWESFRTLAKRALRRAGSLVPFPVGRPKYGKAPSNPAACISAANDKWFSELLVSAGMIGRISSLPEAIRSVERVLARVTPDDYVDFLRDFYNAGLRQFGDDWAFADLTTVLWAAAKLIKPRSYLEIGVRRGRSLAVIASAWPDVDIVGFDLWLPTYAGMPNPGPQWVREELGRLGFHGQLELIQGDSRIAVPRYLSKNPGTFFDLIAVDGDHSRRGASVDLKNVLPRLSIGGAIVFDDIAHPKHPGLARVWQRIVAGQDRFDSWEFTGLGFGVGVGLRKY